AIDCTSDAPLLPSNNLSDLGSAATSRTNLGLGVLATASSVNLATQASGTLQAAQFPALTGDVTTSPGTLTTSIGAGKATNTMLAGSVAVTKLATTGTADATVFLRGDGVWTAVSTSAAGSTGYVQFNSSSALAGDSNLFWDNTNKRLGIGTATPAQKLSVAGTIESISGGFKFPDGTTQTTA